ncbi:uncharacterized protein [Anabrus simplex]|uniref:uncharacterized protein isoform X2 n=1 Tax=Anabrus simplex TaxID=316456 RepID=UPI0034DDAD15
MAASISTGCASVTYLQLALLVLAALLVNNNQGKQIRCACTSQECKDMKVRSCSTDYKCFTHLTDKRDGSKPSVVFGCVTSDAQLLCDNRGPSHTKVGLTHVQCCNDRSYCNNEDFNPKQWTLPRLQPAAAPGRPLRCACSTRDCLENKSDTCSTEFKCYTQYLNKGDGSNPVSFGCTAGSSPLLCENRPPTKAIADWPYIQCCDYSDYCNTGRFIGPPQMARLRLPVPSTEVAT